MHLTSTPPNGEPPLPSDTGSPTRDLMAAGESELGYEGAFPFLLDAEAAES
jgi:hypothetical protein